MNELFVFAKFWEPGRVKTRLAEDVGHQAASRIYREFLVTLLARLSDFGDRRTLAFTPEERGNEFEALAAGLPWELTTQPIGDLGQRMHRMFQQRFDDGADAVVLMGSDSPTIPGAYVEQAFEGLREQDVVLGPSADGGYYLVGLRCPVPGLFSGIDWSTSHVWEQTMQRLRDDRLEDSVLVLPQWYDIDSLPDLRRLFSELSSMPDDGNYGELLECCRNVVLATPDEDG